MSDPHTGEKPGWFDKPGNIRLIIIGLVVACLISFAVPTAMDWMSHEESHRHFHYEDWSGFHAVFGFFAYALIVISAKGLRKILMRPEDYYD
jgi:hypothetical protein